MRFHGKAREYNELVQMLYNITYSQTHESLLPEKDDARAFTRFVEHLDQFIVFTGTAVKTHLGRYGLAL